MQHLLDLQLSKSFQRVMSMAQQWIILIAMSMDTLMTIPMNIHIHIHMNSCQTLDCGQRETNWSIEQIGNR